MILAYCTSYFDVLIFFLWVSVYSILKIIMILNPNFEAIKYVFQTLNQRIRFHKRYMFILIIFLFTSIQAFVIQSLFNCVYDQISK